jgi:hypothetical protein
MTGRRTHHKVQELPQELTAAVDRLIAEGVTYREIADRLEQFGHKVGKSSVARYGRQFLARLEKLKVIEGQTRAIIDGTGGLDVDAEQAASRVALARIVEFLMEAEDLSEEKFSSVVHALARLQSSSVARERLKMLAVDQMKTAAEQLQSELKKELSAHPELLEKLSAIIRSRLEVQAA